MKLKVVFIDEIAMIGYELFKKQEQRLQEIMESPKSFGKLHIIAIGDFYQLAPVQDTPLYTLPKKGYNTLATNLFQDYFKICTFTEIMHQKGKKNSVKYLIIYM